MNATAMNIEPNNALAKAINNPKNTVSIRKQLTPEVFKKIQKLGTVAKAMAIKSKNIPNPSGTAKVLARGYAMLKDHHNNYISTVSEVQSSKYITANLKDGQIKLSRFN